jgi:hypothetical protein
MRYTVGAGGILAPYCIYPEIIPALTALGVRKLALVSTPRFPAYNESSYADDAAQLFATPTPFLAALVADMIENGIYGANFDFEDVVFENATLSTAYVGFLLQAEAALAAHGLSTSVDVNLAKCKACHALSGSTISAVMVMDTYAQFEAPFFDALHNATTDVDKSQLVIGLEDWPNFVANDVALRFRALAVRRLCHMALWRMPINDIWWPFLRAYAANATACNGGDYSMASL